MKHIAKVMAALLLFAATGAYAHGPEKGPNGGQRVDAGNYHVELLARDTSLTAFLSDSDDKPVDAKGFKAVGVFVIGGKPQRIELLPQSDNRLTGEAPVAVPEAFKGTLNITPPDGNAVQAKFE